VSSAKLIRDMVNRHGFAKATHGLGLSRRYWFKRQAGEDISQFLCFEYKSNLRMYSMMYGYESHSVRAEALTLIDDFCIEVGAEPISESKWGSGPCLTMFALPSPTLGFRVPEGLDNFAANVLAPLDESDLQHVRNLSELCTALLRTDDSFDWTRSASAFRLVYAAILVKRLSLGADVFWNSVSKLPMSWLSDHVAVVRTGLTGNEFLERLTHKLGITTAHSRTDHK
jgi:hypothetical protein